MVERLWAPWRMDYIVGPKPGGCVFCDAMSGGSNRREENLILREGALAFIMMNRYPYTHGHVMVIPKKHVSDMEELSLPEQRALFDFVVQGQSAIRKALSPHGLNLGMNIGKAAGAGIDDHLHMHIVPRWHGDTNFMPLIADARSMPEHLLETYRTYRPFFEDITERKD